MSIIAGALQGLGQGLSTAGLLGIQDALEQKKQRANQLFEMNMARFKSDLDTERLTKIAGIEAEGKAADRAATFENQQALERIKAGNRAADRAADFENQKALEGIKADNAAKENAKRNDLKERGLQLKTEEAQQKRDQMARNRAADVEAANSSIDNMLNTTDRILQTPVDVIEAAAGPVSSRLPTIRQDTADFEALVDNLKSQAFLAQVPNLKGMGALSDAEGKKITDALQNFSLTQSPKQMLFNVREAQRLLLKARDNIARRHGVPKTIPDTPNAMPSPEEINSILQQYGVLQ